MPDKTTFAEDEPLLCSFCGKDRLAVRKLVAGPGVYICNECTDLAARIVAEEVGGLDLPEPSIEEALARMVALHRSRQQVDREVAAAVRALRARGVTWTRIGESLGMTRQSAWERYSGEE